MKKIGIVGGMGPESTLDYCKLITGAFQQNQGDSGYPEIIIYSANLAELMKIMEAGKWDELTEWLLKKVIPLQGAGAEFAVIASNTPHVVYPEVGSRAPIPITPTPAETRETLDSYNRAILFRAEMPYSKELTRKTAAYLDMLIQLEG